MRSTEEWISDNVKMKVMLVLNEQTKDVSYLSSIPYPKYITDHNMEFIEILW